MAKIVVMSKNDGDRDPQLTSWAGFGFELSKMISEPIVTGCY